MFALVHIFARIFYFRTGSDAFSQKNERLVVKVFFPIALSHIYSSSCHVLLVEAPRRIWQCVRWVKWDWLAYTVRETCTFSILCSDVRPFLSLYFMLCNNEEFQIELSRKIVLWQIFIGHGSASFPLLSACRLVKFDCFVICHVSLYCYGTFLSQDTLLRSFKSPRICFRGRKHEIYREHVAYLHSILCAGPGCDYNCLQVQ